MNVTVSESNLDLKGFADYIAQSREDWVRRKKEIQAWLSEQPLLLFGFGGKGKALAEQIRELAGKEVTIYDTSPQRRESARQEGFPTVDVLSATDPQEWLVILGACQAQLEQKSFVNGRSLFYQEAASFFHAPHLSHASSDFGEFVVNHVDDHYHVFSSLHPSSQDRFLSVLRFRASNDPTLLNPTRLPASEMWLDIPSSYKIKEYLTFLDVGAYDGDTLKFYHDRFGCSRAIAVEANTSLFDAIKKAAVDYSRGVEILPMAAWSKQTRLKFEEVRGGMIQVTESADGELQAAPMDNYIDETVDCLKMDIEGAESQALEGAMRILKSGRPDLAIAAYHRPQDLIALPEQLNQIGYDSSYQWHFGHYSDCIDDSIFYVLGA
ncbi:MAG: FkbM family methyltransferase [Cyanobacteriota bacterium]